MEHNFSAASFSSVSSTIPICSDHSHSIARLPLDELSDQRRAGCHADARGKCCCCCCGHYVWAFFWTAQHKCQQI